MTYITNFFNYAASYRVVNTGHALSSLGGRISRLSKNFFCNFSFRISKSLMDSFYRSADFYNRFPHLRPTLSNSSSIFNMKLIKPIYPPL